MRKTTTLPSLRARYALVIAVLAVLFTVVAILAHRHVIHANQVSSEDARHRVQRVALVNDGFAQLQRLQQSVFRYLLEPSNTARLHLQASIKRLQTAINNLAPDQGAGGSLIAAELAKDMRRLGAKIDQLATKGSEAQPDPVGGATDRQQLLRLDDVVTSDIEALGKLLSDDAGATTPSLGKTLLQLRETWQYLSSGIRQSLVGEKLSGDAFASYTADQGLMQRLEQLDGLQGRLRQAAAPPHVAEPIMQLSASIDAWQTSLLRLLDQPEPPAHQVHRELVHEHIEPLLQQLHKRLDTLRVALQVQATRQIDALTQTGRNLSTTLLVSLGLMLLLGIAGYVALDRLILLPVRQLTGNLSKRANQSPGIFHAPPAVRETSELLNAFADMQAQVRARERELDHLAHHDALTSLPNRSLFRGRLADAIQAAQQHDMLVGLLFMDLDRFKQVNDSYGHAAGDQMLIEISRRLLKVFRQEDLVARLGGDEFAILLQSLHDRHEMSRLAEKALRAIERPYEFEQQIFYSGASIGIAVAPDDGTDPDRLIQLADTAMYAAKRDEGSSFRYVSEELTATAAKQHALENELREAVHSQRLELHFQPVVATRDGQIHCYESLLRWPHAKQGMLRPASFMDALADAGLCAIISDWALDQIQADVPSAGACLSINLSARLLHDDAFAKRLFARMDEKRLVPSKLILEITEDTLETDLNAASRVLHELKRRGVRIALDDFGTGQASLSHLRRFPFDYIKIDQSFVAGIGRVPNDEKLIQAIVRLAHALDMQVVAEGVETEAQRQFLLDEDCDYVQGYLVGHPSATG